MNPKVSVLLPTYNRADYIERAIESYLEQDYKNTELIVLNDNSTDNTKEVLEKYNEHPRIIIWHSDVNMSPPNNQNFLWEIATGDLVCQLHDDDALTKDSISKRVALFKPETQVVWGGAILQNIHGDRQGLFSGQEPDKNRILKDEYINFTTLMYQRDLPFKFDGTLRYYFDWLFKIRCLNECVCAYTPDPVMYYSMHEGQESSIARATGVNPIQDQLMRLKLIELGYR